jgi:hypothetical protein
MALFFASDWSNKSCDASRSNDIGVVWSFRTKEWERMSPNGVLGKMTYIEPVNVKRITYQKALFLDGSHHDLIAQYMSSPVSFYQQPGVVFEDESVGVTRSLIYPEEDELSGFAEGWKEGWDRKGQTFPIPLDILMGGRAYREPTVDFLADYIMKLLKQRATDSLPVIKLETPEVLQLVNQLACFHYHLAEIQRDRRPAVSLHELTDVVDKLLIDMGYGHLPPCDSLIERSYKDFSWKIIDQAMRECLGST